MTGGPVHPGCTKKPIFVGECCAHECCTPGGGEVDFFACSKNTAVWRLTDGCAGWLAGWDGGWVAGWP